MDSGVHLVLQVHRKSLIHMSKSEHPEIKEYIILLDLTKTRVSSSYKCQMVLKCLHPAKHGMD